MSTRRRLRSRWPRRRARCGRWETIPNEAGALRKLVKQLGAPEHLRMCYEAGPTGYGVYWTLTALGVHCDVIAPSLVPKKAGDRVKTDRRDAEKLARCYRAGDLTPVWVPDAAHEALRDLVRAREAAKGDQLRARHRLSKFLLRQSQRPPAGVRAWTVRYHAWLEHGVHFAQPAQTATFLDYVHEVDHAATRITRLETALDEVIAAAPAALQTVIAALQALRGVARLTAVTIVAEVGPLTRFPNARQLMGYGGFGVREASSGSAHLARRDHENGQCPPAARGHRGGVAVSASPGRRKGATGTASGPQPGGDGDRLEGATSLDQPVSAIERTRETAAASRDRDRARTARLHLGHWQWRSRRRQRPGGVTSGWLARRRRSRPPAGRILAAPMRQAFGLDPRW